MAEGVTTRGLDQWRGAPNDLGHNTAHPGLSSDISQAFHTLPRFSAADKASRFKAARIARSWCSSETWRSSREGRNLSPEFGCFLRYEASAMRITPAALLALVLLSSQPASAENEILAARVLIREIGKVNPAGSWAALKLLDCNVAAAKAVGEADKLTPPAILGDSMAKTAAARCSREAAMAAPLLSPSQMQALQAHILKANAEVALTVRLPPKSIVCASHPCGLKLAR
jgi:hypothetical protein